MRVDSILEQGTGPMNEDFRLVDGNLFGVFDGATSLNKATYDNGCTGGFLASNIAGEVFGGSDGSLPDLAEQANSAIGDAMLRHGVDVSDKGNLWSTSAAVVSVRDDCFEWVQIGDSLIMAVYTDGTHEVLTRDHDHDRETLCMWKDMACSTDECIRAALEEQILKVRRCMNVSYGVLSGEEDALPFINHGRMGLDKVAHLLLFTDGLFIPNCDPARPRDFSLMADLYLEGGLPRVRDHVRNMEAGDKHCRTYPRFKTHDDIAAIAIDFQVPNCSFPPASVTASSRVSSPAV